MIVTLQNIGGFAKAANIDFDTRSTELSVEQSKAVTFRVCQNPSSAQ